MKKNLFKTKVWFSRNFDKLIVITIFAVLIGVTILAAIFDEEQVPFKRDPLSSMKEANPNAAEEIIDYTNNNLVPAIFEVGEIVFDEVEDVIKDPIKSMDNYASGSSEYFGNKQ